MKDKTTSKYNLAFALSGGGSLGALQVGALRALLEAGYQPDLLTGTSIGGINAVFLALHGFNADSIDLLEKLWLDASEQDFLPTNAFRVTMRVVKERQITQPVQRIRMFLQKYGLTPDLRFSDLPGPAIRLVAVDLDESKTLVFGDNPWQSVLEGVLATAALPPWITPIADHKLQIIDGGVMSNLPIEAALNSGAKQIVALEIHNLGEFAQNLPALGLFGAKVANAILARQSHLEKALAKSMGVPVFHVPLENKPVTAFWNFKHTTEMITTGNLQAKDAMAGWLHTPKAENWLKQRFRNLKD